MRPVAKALGTSVSAIATFGLGMSASAHSRSTMRVQLRRLLGRDLAAAHRRTARSGREKNHCATRNPTMRISPRPPQVADQHRAEHDEEQPEQEHRAAHAGGQPAVGAVARAAMARRRSARDQALVASASSVRDLGERGCPRAGSTASDGSSASSGSALARASRTWASRSASARPERRLVAGLDGALQAAVQPVERRRRARRRRRTGPRRGSARSLAAPPAAAAAACRRCGWRCRRRRAALDGSAPAPAGPSSPLSRASSSSTSPWCRTSARARR